LVVLYGQFMMHGQRNIKLCNLLTHTVAAWLNRDHGCCKFFIYLY